MIYFHVQNAEDKKSGGKHLECWNVTENQLVLKYKAEVHHWSVLSFSSQIVDNRNRVNLMSLGTLPTISHMYMPYVSLSISHICTVLWLRLHLNFLTKVFSLLFSVAYPRNRGHWIFVMILLPCGGHFSINSLCHELEDKIMCHLVYPCGMLNSA